MGLIKLAVDAIGAVGGALDTTISGSWIDYFESGDMSNGVIMKRGNKIVGPKSRNKGGDDNIITSGSGIDVQENQCMILVQNGAIVDFCAEPGRYTFDDSLAPSLLSGNNKGLKAMLKQFGTSWLAGGQRTSTQRVFYINLGEIQGFKWGSGNITFEHWERDLMTDRPIWKTATTLMGNGMYSIQVTNPAKFFSVIGAAKAGADGDGMVTRTDIEPQIKTEAIAAIRQGVGMLSQMKIAYTDIAAHEYELTQNVDKLLSADWDESRGISIFKIAIGMMDADEASKERITKFQDTRGYTDPSMLATYMGMGQTQAMKDAANNSAGTGVGFGGILMQNMANPNAAANIAGLMQQGQQNQQMQFQQAQQYQQQAAGWTCSCGQAGNTGKFCMNCGQPKPTAQGAMNNCPNCGTPFANPSNPPKFCPNCGQKVQ
ncbi:MAG: SPFH domain-containing protein [bacterium]